MGEELLRQRGKDLQMSYGGSMLVCFVVKFLSHVQLFVTPWTTACHVVLCLPLSTGVCWNSCSLSWWCHLIISSSANPFSYCLQSFPASESFPMSWLFASGGQSIRASALATVLPIEYSGLISFRTDWFDLPAVQGLLKSVPQHHNSTNSK